MESMESHPYDACGLPGKTFALNYGEGCCGRDLPSAHLFSMHAARAKRSSDLPSPYSTDASFGGWRRKRADVMCETPSKPVNTGRERAKFRNAGSAKLSLVV